MRYRHKPNQYLNNFVTILINPLKDEYNALDFLFLIIHTNVNNTYKCKRLQIRDARLKCNSLHFCRKIWYRWGVRARPSVYNNLSTDHTFSV